MVSFGLQKLTLLGMGAATYFTLYMGFLYELQSYLGQYFKVHEFDFLFKQLQIISSLILLRSYIITNNIYVYSIP